MAKMRHLCHHASLGITRMSARANADNKGSSAYITILCSLDSAHVCKQLIRIQVRHATSAMLHLRKKHGGAITPRTCGSPLRYHPAR